MAIASQALIDALNGTPDLTSSPSLALAAAGTDDPSGAAQALSQATFATTLANNEVPQATAHTSHKGFWGSVLHAAATVAHDTGLSTAAQYLSKPLGEVQHDYRYLRDVYHQHGFWAGLGETTLIVGAGTAAGFFGGPQAGLLAGEAAATALAHTTYQDSYQRTSDPNYMLNGHLISPGRDVAGLLGLDVTSHQGQGSGLGHWLSGSVDAGFDFTADPLMELGALSKGARAGDLAERTAAQAAKGRMVGVNNLVQKVAPGQRIVDATSIQALRDAPVYGAGYRRALDDLARTTSPTEILKRYPDQVGLAERLATADSADAVHQVFLDATNEGELTRRALHNELPSRALMRAPLGRARTAVADTLGVSFERENSIRKALLLPTVANVQGAVSRKIRTFTNTVPVGLDPTTLKISTSAFDATAPTAAKTVHDIFSIGMSPALAKDWTDRFVFAPTLGAKKAIYAEGLVENAKAMGLADNPQAMAYITDLTRSLVHGQGPNTSYGIGHALGDDVNTVTWQGPDGAVSDRLAQFGWQADNTWGIPNFKILRNAVSDMSKNPAIRIAAQADEWVANKIIDPIFRSMVLNNPAFGMRVGFSEAVNQIMRDGTWNYLRSRGAYAAAKHNYRLAGPVNTSIDSLEEGISKGDEASHVVAAAIRSLGGPSRAIRAPKEDVDLAMSLMVRHQGHFVNELANSGHNSLISPDNAAVKAADAAWYLPGHDKRLTSRFTDDYRQFDRNDKNYTGYWLKALNNGAHEPSVQAIAADLATSAKNGVTGEEAFRAAVQRETHRINGVDPTTGTKAAVDPYAAERDKLARYNRQNPVEFATHRVDTVRNYLTGADGTFHTALADLLSDGKHVGSDSVLDKIGPESRPEWLSGADEVPNIGPGLLSRINQWGFRRGVQPFVQNLSRNPLFFAQVKTQMKSLQHAIDQGVLTEDEALTVAEIRGSIDMLPRIHNTYLRSQASVMVRNILPFYFAQEQAMRRVGLVVAKNPAAIRGFQLEAHALNDPGFSHTDANGNRSLVLPGGGLLGAAMLHGLGAAGIGVQYGLPLSFNGNMSSLDTVVPTLKAPGVSPLVAVSLNTLEHYAPGMAPVVKAVEGPGYNKSLRDELIPNAFLRNAVNALSPQQRSAAWSNAYVGALAAAAAHGQTPGPDATPQQRQAFLDRNKHNAQSAFFTKAVLSLFSPLSPTPVLEDATGAQTWRDEFRQLANPDSKTYAGSYAQALLKFQAAHGDAAMSYTIAKSDSPTGFTAASVQPALDFLRSHRDLLAGPNGLGAAFLTPQSGAKADGQLVYAELLKDGLRAQRTPQQYLDAIYTAEGDRQFFASYDVHKTNLRNLTPGSDAYHAENAAWSAWFAEHQAANPIWAVNFDPLQRQLNAQQAVQDLTTILSSPGAPQGEQTDLVAGLLSDYQRHLQNLSLARSGAVNFTVTAEKDAWGAYLDQRASDDPRVGNVVRTVFKRL